MIDVALSLMALIGAGVSLELFAAAEVPPPPRDDEGFYLIADAISPTEETPIGNPS